MVRSRDQANGRVTCVRSVGVRRAGRLLLLTAVVGCNVPVAASLDEDDANRIVRALDRANIDSTKEVDPVSEGKVRVTVARDDVPRALSAMRDEELPRPRPPGVLDSMDKGALVPSQAAEHAQYVAGVAGDLERTLESVDGVLGARVHLNLPEESALREAPVPKATASVLVAHRGSTPPLTTDAVQRLVAGGVAGLAAADVSVVMVSRPAPAARGEAQLAHVGPIAVARSSARLLQLALAGLALLVAMLAGAALLSWSRLREARALRDGEQKEPGPAARSTQ
jgi:type III secretion protein J